MEIFYFGLITFLFILATFDLVVGVSNDAVNFLNSAIGAKATSFKTIIAIAAIGILCGALMSNGMMEIARHGIFRPEQFYFNELIYIFLAVMITDIILLDVFNSLGMPTSTTVSMVFELLGGTFALAMLKIISDTTGSLAFADLLNTEKALSVIFGIFLSVGIAFFFGTLVQYIVRMIFTFNYKKRLKWGIGIFGGIAATSIIYFMIIKGIKEASFMTAEMKSLIREYSGTIVFVCLIFFTILMQVLYWRHVNVFKVIVLMGTFALALAFAGNDLVNFIGVPLAGFFAYLDFAANGTSAGADKFLMSSLNGPAQTPFIFLLIAGIIMALSLTFSKKAQNVVKTSLDLSKQEAGDEMFGSSLLARSLVRHTTNVSGGLLAILPNNFKKWMDSRFNKEEVILEKGASFDLVRASVNLMLAGLLIALGTSLKLPLSTTYVTFMVAMGSSLADRAWGRESAVFRITGVMSVIGGWFITAGVAFIVCFAVTLGLCFGGIIAVVAMIGLAALILIRSNIRYRKKTKIKKSDEIFKTIVSSHDKEEVWNLLKKHSSETLSGIIEFAKEAYTKTTTGFIHEDLRILRKVNSELNTHKEMLKKIRKQGLMALRQIDKNIALEKNTWFHLANNSIEQMIYCMKRMNEPCKEHVDNNFNPLPGEYADEFTVIREFFESLMERIKYSIENSDYKNYEQLFFTSHHVSEEFSRLRHKQIERIQESKNEDLNVSIVYINILQESQELVSILRHLLRASRKFQAD
ncbi:MAG: inorganic phosphate transporter [Tannerella sp.]|jgi:phosphate/sulfate permease|nr:inorganic phosphate transporter [Tannerella sp.]